MKIHRRGILKGAGLIASLLPIASSTVTAAEPSAPVEGDAFKFTDWERFRDEFDFDFTWRNFAGFLLATRPRMVDAEIERHRKHLRRNPANYLADGYAMEEEARRWAGRYFGVAPNQISLTDNTTMGLATLYNGINIRPDQEILSTEHEHYSSVTSLKYRSMREGFRVNTIRLYEEASNASTEEILDRIKANVTPKTRVLALTWVHSGSSVKLPIAEIGKLVIQLNRGRAEEDRLLYCVDGVHGFGVDDIQFDDIGCDYFVAGTHKWMFGPSGTGIMCSRDVDLQTMSPTIPAFNFTGEQTFGPVMTPGGFHSFEHRWALHKAFEFHLLLGKANVQKQIRFLNTYLKEQLREAPGVELMTPMSPELSAGFTFFRAGSLDPNVVQQQMYDNKIIVSAADRDAGPVVRMAPGLLNSTEEIDHAVKVITAIANA